MNDHFVCIKVDREERPDVDEIYMEAVQALTGQGGWPMTVFLDARAASPSTAAPTSRRDDRRGMPGFRSVLHARRSTPGGEPRRVREQRGDHRGTDGDAPRRSIEPSARAAARPSARRGAPRCSPHASTRARRLRRRAEVPAPAGPRCCCCVIGPPRAGDETLDAWSTHTLDAWRAGGIYDQLGGGFHRYCARRALARAPLREDALRQRAARAASTSRPTRHWPTTRLPRGRARRRSTTCCAR